MYSTFLPILFLIHDVSLIHFLIFCLILVTRILRFKMVLLSFLSACATVRYSVLVLFVFVQLAVKKLASGKLYFCNTWND